MNDVLLLTRKPDLYSVRRLVEEMEKRQIVFRILEPEADQFGTPSVVLPRLGTWRFQEALEKLLPMNEKFRFINSLSAYQKSRNKWNCQQMVAAHGIPVPLGQLISREEFEFLTPEFPFVLKEIYSCQGLGVALIQNPENLKKALENMKSSDLFLAQEYIGESHGRDVRILATARGDYWAMERKNPTGDIRSNLHVGGQAFPVEIRPEEVEMAFEALEVFSLDYAGVDILRSKQGSLLLEVNPCPGFEGLEKIHGPQVAGALLELI